MIGRVRDRVDLLSKLPFQAERSTARSGTTPRRQHLVERIAQCAVQFKRRARDLLVRDVKGLVAWREA